MINTKAITKLFSQLLLPAVLFSLMSCNLGEEDKTNDDAIVPQEIKEEGVYGSWSHRETVLPMLSTLWYIEGNQTRIFRKCKLGNKVVTIGFIVESEVSDGILTLLQGDSKSVTESGQTCSISATANTSYVLSLIDKNTLTISLGTEDLTFNRMHPINRGADALNADNEESEEDQN